MEILKVAEVGVEAAALRAAAVLHAGGVVLYPTDTLYGLGADALSDEAVERIRAIKGRDDAKPLHCIVSDLDMAEQYADIGPAIRQLAHQLPQGKISFIAPKHSDIESGIARDMQTLGFRIPDHQFCRAMLAAFDGPITATSANVAGAEALSTPVGILGQLGATMALIDLVIDGGEAPLPRPSTVVDLSHPEHPVILREGAVAAGDVWEVLRGADAAHG